MVKASVFDIRAKQQEQIEAEMKMSPIERLHLTLNLMQVFSIISPEMMVSPKDDNIDWITLKFVDPNLNP